MLGRRTTITPRERDRKRFSPLPNWNSKCAALESNNLGAAYKRERHFFALMGFTRRAIGDSPRVIALDHPCPLP